VRHIILIIFAFVFINSYSQNVNDSILLQSTYKGFEFYSGGQKINTDQVFGLMENNDEAWEEFNASREAFFFGTVFGILGGALVVLPFAQSALGKKANYDPAFAGICFIGISVPIFRSHNKKTVNAIELYNSKLNYHEDTNLDVSFGYAINGLGIKITF